MAKHSAKKGEKKEVEYSATRRNLSLYYKPILMPGGYQWSHVDTMKFIALYYNSKFQNGDTTETGYRRYFKNICKPPCDVASKFVDLDTKDIILVSEATGDDHKVWLMQRDLRNWLKEKKFASLLNVIDIDYPKYGSVVTKRTKQGEWHKVNLENMRFDPSAGTLNESMFVYEIQLMTIRQLHEANWDKEKVEALVENNPDCYQFRIYECYDYQPEGKMWRRTFQSCINRRKGEKGVIEVPESDLGEGQDYLDGDCLFEDEQDELPYRELHWERVPGRWLGLGFVEYLLPNQIRVNELVDMKAESMRIASLHLFQTNDETIGKNVLTSMVNGQILTTATPMTPVSTEERNLAAYSEEEQSWGQNTQQKTFSFDIARGGDLPSQTPLGVAQLSAEMVNSYFSLKRENFGLFIRDIILDDVLPAFKKENKKKHILKFMTTESDTNKLVKALTEHTMRKAFWDYAVRTGTVPSRVAWELEKVKVEGTLKKRKDISLEIPDSYYDDVKVTMDIVVTGEQMDVGQRQQTYMKALEIMGSRPEIMTNPALRQIFSKMLQLAGVSLIDLEIMEEKAEEAMQNQPQMPPGMPPPQGAPQKPQMMPQQPSRQPAPV